MTRFIRFKRSFEHIRFEAPVLIHSGNAFLPTTALVPLQQHEGSPAMPVVSAGERVREGQLLARGTSSDSANIHAPIPGILKEIRTVSLPDGKRGQAAVISLSGSFDILGRKQEQFPWRLSPESEILRVLEDKGVINTFDHPVPLVPMLRAAKKTGDAVLALRLFDYDPTCQLDSWLASEQLRTVLEGTAILAKSFDAKTVYLVHDDKAGKGPATKLIEEIFGARKVTVLQGDKRYPSGNVRRFTHLLKEKAPVLVDPVTALSAYEAVVNNQPGLQRYVAISGPALGSPAILRVRVGTPIGDVIEECGGFRTDPSRIVVNGLLTGTALYDLDTPVTKYTKSLHIMDRDTCPSYTVRECIHCGRCLQVCPVSIDPMRTVYAINRLKTEPAVLKSIAACQFCGCCAIVCPSRIPLHQIIREAAVRQKGTVK